VGQPHHRARPRQVIRQSNVAIIWAWARGVADREPATQLGDPGSNLPRPGLISSLINSPAWQLCNYSG
jgi:hypothetical protein